MSAPRQQSSRLPQPKYFEDKEERHRHWLATRRYVGVSFPEGSPYGPRGDALEKAAKRARQLEKGGSVLRRGSHLNHSAFTKGAMIYKNDIPKTKPFPFMKLPLELRQEVYSHLLISLNPIVPRIKHWRKNKFSGINWFSGGVAMALLTLNKQVSEEVRQFIYANNTFQLSIPYHINWLNSITNKNSFYIRSIQLDHEGKRWNCMSNFDQMMNSVVNHAPTIQGMLLRVHHHGAYLRHGPEILLRQAMMPVWPKLKSLKTIIIERDSSSPIPLTQAEELSVYQKIANRSGTIVIAQRARPILYPQRLAFFSIPYTDFVHHLHTTHPRLAKGEQPKRDPSLLKDRPCRQTFKLQKREREAKIKALAELEEKRKDAAERKVVAAMIGHGMEKTRHGLHMVFNQWQKKYTQEHLSEKNCKGKIKAPVFPETSALRHHPFFEALPVPRKRKDILPRRGPSIDLSSTVEGILNNGGEQRDDAIPISTEEVQAGGKRKRGLESDSDGGAQKKQKNATGDKKTKRKRELESTSSETETEGAAQKKQRKGGAHVTDSPALFQDPIYESLAARSPLQSYFPFFPLHR